MSRHHPYGGGGGGGAGWNDYGPPGGGGYDGPGPARGRGRGGGAGRGRGGWDGGPGPDRDYGMRGPPPSGPYRGYDDFDPAAPRGRGRGRGGFGRGGGGGGGGGPGGGGGGPPRYDDGFHDAVVTDRVERERPCRTLFVRNIKYGTSPAEVREKFERIGEIKTFFDLSQNRGMVFITYFDLRAATIARDRLNGTEIGGRPIDVHYSLPKDNELEKRCDRDKNQGTLFLTLTNSARPFTDEEIRAVFGVFGDIKIIKPFKDSSNHRFIEFWDSRACEAAHDNLVGTEYNGGRLDIKFSWDTGMVPQAKLPRDMRGGGSPPRDDGFGRRPGPGPGPGHGPPLGPRDGPYGGGFRDDYGNGPYNDQGYGPPRGRDDGYGGPPPPRNDGYGMPPPGPQGPYGPPGGYGGPPPAMPPQPPQQPAAPTLGARLDQAQKVQELLASLNRAGGAPPGGPPMQNGPPPSQPYMPPQQQQQPPPQQPPYQAPYGDYGGYQQGPPPGPSQPPPGQFSPPPPTQPSAYRSVDPRQAPHAQAPPPSAPAPPTAPASSLPPAILALLSAAGGSKPPGQPGIPAGSALPGNLSPGKPPALSTPGPAPAVPAAAPGQPNNQAVQQLLALLQQQSQPR